MQVFGRRHDEAIHALARPATEKGQGTKSRREVPGMGWRGFDPSHGNAVTDAHAALCAAPDQAATMPVEGSFYGNGVTSILDYRVQIAATWPAESASWLAEMEKRSSPAASVAFRLPTDVANSICGLRQ